MTPILLAVAALLASGVVYIYLYVGRREKNLPPGPPTIPVLGNLHQIPKKGAHFQFTKWAEQYGGIYTLKLGTGTAAVITDRRLVKELIDKRSSKYSERPKSYVAKLISGGDHILLMDYGQQWRDTRKLLHGTFTEKVVEEQHLKIQEAEARQMLRDYLVAPEHHMLHPKRYSNSITMSIVWGVRTPTAQTRHLHRLYDLMEVWSKVMETGATPPVDIYPFLHWLPQTVFLNWVDRATHVQKEMNGLYADFLRDIRARRAKVGSRGAFMDKVLDQAESEKRMDGLSYSDHELWFMGGTLTEGGSDTSASIILAFVQAMVAYPEVQKKAQAEIDSVVGEDRSPNWQDYSCLPYVAQCVKEAMRWRPVTPLAFPHALAEDDWIDGMLLPKGTVIIVNAWGMQHDPKRFGNPEVFDPDHYSGCTTLATELANGPWEKRDHYGYGTGRRFCPGAHLAERNLFLAMAKLLWAFDITSKDTADIDTDPVTGYCEGFLVCVNDFDADFRPRGETRKQTIFREYEEVKTVFEPFHATGDEKA
ncbi:hypothetical protein LTR56_025864 [Elasticomyces elasticus]|nr:hypothetical protein LTR56_025864 [Elasticomyces elasticus]KAK3620509.1 hypothetical protein LTR22_025571 [Elasticomyces elasticus]KAK4904071.1 hypothetical protein LTR49_026420 [Elasticomyces elasticus]KAK5768076.1 hypothetical protein LTS12_001560 [Elasticomyces elasticus]